MNNHSIKYFTPSENSVSGDSSVSASAGNPIESGGLSDHRLKRIYNLYFNELRAYIYRTFGAGPPEPEDVAQSAFTRYAMAKERGNIENPRAYLYATARNVIMDVKRKHKSHENYTKSVLHQQHNEYELSPERVLLGEENMQLLFDTLATMPERRRQMFILNHIDGLSFMEIGRRFNMSEGGVRKHVKKALIECLQALADINAAETVNSSKP